MSEYKFYLPIKSVNLPHYFVKGIISPVKYIENRNIDLQNKFEDYLLLSDTPFTSETNCALEIVLEKEEEDPTPISDNFFLFENPLPISRIKQVIFQEEKQKVNSVFSISSGGAFLPNNLLTVLDDKITIDCSQLNQIVLEKKELVNWAQSLSFFDRLMGGFALMRVSAEDKYNYPTNYFGLLSIINNCIKGDVKKQKIPISKKYDWAIKNEGKQEKLFKAIYSKVTNKDIETSAADEGVEIRKKNGKILIAREDTRTYLINILASYGEGARMSLDSFFSDFHSDKFESERKEGIALIFGLNKGYEIFRNNYKTQNFEVDVKFKLDSKLDYYTIESIYQYSVNDKLKNSVFDYLDNWCNKNKVLSINNQYTNYNILDKRFYYKKKEAGYPESFQAFLDNLFFENEIFKKKYIGLTKKIATEEELKHLLYFVYNEKNNIEQKEESTPIKSSDSIIYPALIPKEELVSYRAEPLPEKYTKSSEVTDKNMQKRKGKLESLNITNLRKEGRKFKIKGASKWENSLKGKKTLIAEILDKEFKL